MGVRILSKSWLLLLEINFGHSGCADNPLGYLICENDCDIFLKIITMTDLQVMLEHYPYFCYKLLTCVM